MNMEKKFENEVLFTERLTLRPFRTGDGIHMFKNWASDDEVVRFLSYVKHESVEVSESIVQMFEREQGENSWRFAICEKGSDEPIGSIGLEIMSARDQNAEVGYSIAKKFWCRGYATEALLAVLEFGFVKIGLERIEAAHAVINPSSGKVMEKAGMKFEGTLRHSFKSGTLGFLDTRLYAIIKSDMELK